MTKLGSRAGAALFMAAVCVGCAASNESAKGVENAQAPNECLQRDSPCHKDRDCCSNWCATGECHIRAE